MSVCVVVVVDMSLFDMSCFLDSAGQRGDSLCYL